MVLTLRSGDPARRATFLASGVVLIEVGADAGGRIDLAAALQALGARGLTRLLVEGGAGLAGALLRLRLVDRLVWMHAPLLIGGDGTPAIGAFGIAALADAPRFARVSTEASGADVVTTFRVNE